MILRKKITALFLTATLASSGIANATGIPVFDGANQASQIQNLLQWGKQLIEMKNQLDQMKAQYDSLNGTRGIANLLKNDLINQYLPEDYQAALDALLNDGSGDFDGISGSLESIVNATQLYTCEEINDDADLQDECKKRWTQFALNKKVGQMGYEKAAENIANLQQYVNSITATTDPKSLMDLQARIAVEQVRMQNEQVKLTTIAMMKKAEEELQREKASNAIDKSLAHGASGGISFTYKLDVEAEE